MIKEDKNNSSIFQSDRVWFPEDLYSNWIGLSIVLLTTSILFFHMSNNVSIIKSNRFLSIFISIFILLTAIALSIGSIVHYYQRINNIQIIDSVGDRENRYLYFYVTMGCVITLLECLVLVFILKNKS